jgi:hypothetical protein
MSLKLKDLADFAVARVAEKKGGEKWGAGSLSY